MTKAQMAAFFKHSTDEGCPGVEISYGCCLYQGMSVTANIPLSRTYFDRFTDKGSLDDLL
jgi:hypothetical protein